jgi:hypothetical protein
MVVDDTIVDFSTAILIRYFRKGMAVTSHAPRLSLQRDIEVLRAHWALSQPVRDLVQYALANPHEVQRLSSFTIRVDDAFARGRIDARKTWLHRLQSGLPFAIISEEPVRTFNTGPNFVLAWVLKQAANHTVRLMALQGPQSPYQSSIHEAQLQIRSVLRVEALRAVSADSPPSPSAVKMALRSRHNIYRLAARAYLLLQGLEHGDPDALRVVIQSTLFGPLENWRIFELAVGLGTAEALAQEINAQLEINVLAAGFSGAIATVGKFDIFWQQKTDFYTPPALEPSEQATRDHLAKFGITIGTDRPDFVIVDRDVGAIRAIIEVKYVAGDGSETRFREAVEQVVRYSRGYGNSAAAAAIVSRSLVAISKDAPKLLESGSGALSSVDLDGMVNQNALASWATQLAAPL